MEIRPSIKSSDLSGRIGGDYQGGAGGGDLLSQLSQRVSDALSKGSAGTGTPLAQNTVDSQQVKSYISGLSAQPLAGMTHSVIC